LERESVLPFWAGVILGIAYGAGLIIDATENDNFHGRQAFLVSVFLGLAHALIEDTLLFAALGASVFWVLVPRVAAACVLTWACADVSMFQNFRAKGRSLRKRVPKPAAGITALRTGFKGRTP
ncbi:MAG TPA: hypothetical protein VGM51_03720, partial [Armatimonadota bacterium]